MRNNEPPGSPCSGRGRRGVRVAARGRSVLGGCAGDARAGTAAAPAQRRSQLSASLLGTKLPPG